MLNSLEIQSFKEKIENLLKENEQYSIKRESIIEEISEEAKTGHTLIGKIGLGVLKGLSNIGEITRLSEKITNNEKVITDVSTELVFDLLNKHNILDINSLHDNGLDFLSNQQLEAILEKAVEEKRLEKIKLTDTTLYKKSIQHNM